MKKIVYFDEESALDWLDQQNDGRMEEINKEIVNKGKNFFSEGEVNAEAGISHFLSALKFKGKGRVKGDYSREGTTVIEKTVTNTILTTFTNYIDPSKGGSLKEKIERIENVKLSLVNNSITFFKTITPIFKLFPNTVTIDDTSLKEMNMDSIDLSNFEDVIDTLKGYFEFKAYNKNTGDEKVVRFNSNSLRNNYRLTDFLSMDLVMYGVKVGNASLNQFDISNVFNDHPSETHQISLADFSDEQPKKNTLDQMEIIDIILAGIE